MSKVHQQWADLRFAAQFGDGQALLADLQARALAVGYSVDLDPSAKIITYDTRVIARHIAKSGHPKLFDCDPFYGMMIEDAAHVFNVPSVEV